LPSRFRRQRILIVGCGDVGLRVAGLLGNRVSLLALTSSTERVGELRAKGVRPLHGNLDNAQSLKRLAGIATRVVHLAPPPPDGWIDSRTRDLMRALRLRQKPFGVVYGSTSGVYGNCAGDWVNEVRAVNAQTPRAYRRVDAESRVRFFGKSANARISILRIPGIYANDREGGTPKARIMRATPVLEEQDDVFTNHIQADDLARACCLTLWRGSPQRAYNVNDDSSMKMGDYFDLAADLYGLPRPPRVSRAGAIEQLPLMLLSFMSESRRMDNTRMKKELRLKLRFPTVIRGLG
jgi:nucleoside-diphosphate-sugar epimerase